MFNWSWQALPSINDTKLEVVQSVSDAMEKMHLLLSKDKRTLKLIFQEIENTEDPNELQVAFPNIKNYFRYLLRVKPPHENYTAVRTALEKLGTSVKFLSHLQSASSLEDALYSYKTDVLQTLSDHLKKSEEEDAFRSNLDKKLFQRYFPHLILSTELQKPIKERISPDRPSSKKRKSIGKFYSGTPSRPRRARDTSNDVLRRKNVCIAFQDRKCHRGKGCRFKHLYY